MAVMETILFGVLIGGLILLAGGVLLQIFLSRRESRWPGLVLPLLASLNALLLFLNEMDGFTGVLPALAALLGGNVPTLVLLVIYWVVREKRGIQTQIEKMGKQDIGEL